MKRRLTGRLKWCVTQVTAMLVAALCCTACGSVFDDEGDCAPHYYVRFVYDMNMLYTDAFATQVGSVDLYVFDAETGEYVAHLDDKGEALASGTYRMPLDVPPGKYKLIAWCGLADNDDDFTLRSGIRPEDMECTMARSHDENGAYSKRNLHALYHGMAEVELPDEEGEHVRVVKLTKDTNNIVLSLQHTGGALDPDRFEVTLTDDNGMMTYDNSLMDDEPIAYRPWTASSGTIDMDEEDVEPEYRRKTGYMKVELATARLMTGHNTRIVIYDKMKEKVVFSIPFVQWALLYRSENHAKMDAQEYLDRRDEYELMVFLADIEEGWMVLEIVINGWHVIINDGIEL